MDGVKKAAERLINVYSEGGKPPENLKLILRYMKKLEHGGQKPDTLKLAYQSLTIFSKWCKIQIDEISEDDIYSYFDYLNDHKYLRSGKEKGYSESSKTTFKIHLRSFFKFLGREDLVKVFVIKNTKLEPLDKSKLLTKADIEKLLKACENSRDRAIIALLFESGCRRGELLSMRICDIEFNSNGLKATFPKSKSGKRTVQLVFTSSFIRQFLEDHPYKDDVNNFLFCSLHGSPNMTEHALNKQLKKIADRAGVKKRANPHSYRHAAATYLSEHLTESQLKKQLGWTQSSMMAQIYVHDPDTDNAILKMYGIETEEKENNTLKVVKCPRCKELNPNSSRYCGKCGLPLKDEAITQDTKDSEAFDTLIFELAASPKFRQLLDNYKKTDKV